MLYKCWGFGELYCACETMSITTISNFSCKTLHHWNQFNEMINFGQHLDHHDLSCLLVLIQVNQQVEHFPFQKLPVDMPGSWALNMTNKIKAGQWGSSSSLRPFDRDAQLEVCVCGGDLSRGYEWGSMGSYKGHVWEVSQFIEEKVWIKCLFIEVIRVSPHCQAWPLILSSEAPKQRGREGVLLPQFAGSSQLSWGDAGTTSLDRCLLHCSVKLQQVSCI